MAKNILLAGVMAPTLLIAQTAGVVAAPDGVRVAQAQPQERPHPQQQKPAAPAVRPPQASAPAPGAAPRVAPPLAAPGAPRATPPAPQPLRQPAQPTNAPRNQPRPAAPPAASAPLTAPQPVQPKPWKSEPRMQPQRPPPVQSPTTTAPAVQQPDTAAPGAKKPPRGPRVPGAVPPVLQAPATNAQPPATILQPPAPAAQPPAAGVRTGAPGATPGVRPQGGAPLPPLPGQPLRPPAPGAAQPGQTGAPLAQPPAANAPSAVQPPGAPGAVPPVQRVPDAPLPPPGQPPRANSGRIGPAGAAALGVAAGAVGGFLLTRPGAEPRSIDAVQRERREFRDRDALIYQEPGRTIVRDGDRYFLRHDEAERFRALGSDVRTERRGDQFVTVYRGRDGDEIVTVTDANGNLIRRYRRVRDGGEIVIIDNSYRGGPRAYIDEVVTLPPPPIRIPRERYIVDAGVADERLIYDTLTAPPVAPIPRRFTLDEIRSSPDVRAYTRSVDLDTVNFDTGSWTLAPDQVQKLGALAQALNKAIERNASEVYLVEGHTDAVGAPVDNISLSDRRAQAVAEILTRNFGVPPENLTSQGYGEQYLKVQTQGPERRNRRVVVRRITNLLSGQNQ